MNKKLLKQFEKRLMGEREKLLAKLNLEKEAFVDLKRNEVGDIVDKAFTQWEKDRAIDISEGDKRVLVEIDRALHRMRTGGYGVCILCNCDIDPMRLEALPWTQTCVDPKRCRANKAANPVKPAAIPVSKPAEIAVPSPVAKSSASKSPVKASAKSSSKSAAKSKSASKRK
jgi:DnaK suppressor protein